MPIAFSLSQNYPNPFGTTTEIRFDLPVAVEAQLAVYDLLGREVTRLAEGLHEAGRHHVRFEAGHYPSGVYLYRLSAGNHVETRSMMVLR